MDDTCSTTDGSSSARPATTIYIFAEELSEMECAPALKFRECMPFENSLHKSSHSFECQRGMERSVDVNSLVKFVGSEPHKVGIPQGISLIRKVHECKSQETTQEPHTKQHDNASIEETSIDVGGSLRAVATDRSISDVARTLRKSRLSSIQIKRHRTNDDAVTALDLRPWPLQEASTISHAIDEIVPDVSKPGVDKAVSAARIIWALESQSLHVLSQLRKQEQEQQLDLERQRRFNEHFQKETARLEQLLSDCERRSRLDEQQKETTVCCCCRLAFFQ